MLLTNFYLYHLSFSLQGPNPLPLLFAPFLLFFFFIILSTFRYFPTFLSQFLHSFLLDSILYIDLFFSIFSLLLHPSSSSLFLPSFLPPLFFLLTFPFLSSFFLLLPLYFLLQFYFISSSLLHSPFSCLFPSSFISSSSLFTIFILFS